MDRTCRVCEGRMSVYETRTLAGMPLILRYRCGCGTKFDLFSPLGEIFACASAAIIPGVILLSPDKKFANPDDRWMIFALASLLSVGLVALLVRSRKNARSNPLLP